MSRIYSSLVKYSVDKDHLFIYTNNITTQKGTEMAYTITYHPEKDFGYQWKLSVNDDFSKMTIHFETKTLAEQYVIFSLLEHGQII